MNKSAKHNLLVVLSFITLVLLIYGTVIAITITDNLSMYGGELW